MRISGLFRKSEKQQKCSTVRRESAFVTNAKSSNYFQEDKAFADELWFQRPQITMRFEHSRPVLCRRILKVQEESGKPSFSNDGKSKSRAEYKIPKSFIQSIKKQSQHHQSKLRCTQSKKNSFFRQLSDIPDYARNIMKPCKIKAANIIKRPSTCRKIYTVSKRREGIELRRLTERANQKSYQKEASANSTRNWQIEIPISIEPWDQFEEDDRHY